MHLLSGIPIAVTGFLGSWMVISVNAWMNHPSGFRLVAGRVVDVHPWKALFGNEFLWHELIHMYIAAQRHRPSRSRAAARATRYAH
jgi:cytochrome bd ubiquinol oxidase subunit I